MWRESRLRDGCMEARRSCKRASRRAGKVSVMLSLSTIHPSNFLHVDQAASPFASLEVEIGSVR